MFRLPERDPLARADKAIQERYASAIASWDADHHRDSRGFLPEQRERWLRYITAINGDFSFEHATFWQWLVERGRVVL